MLSQKSPIPSPQLPYPLIPIFLGPGVIFNNKRTSGGITILDLKLYYKANDRQVDQWNRTDDTGMNPLIYGHLIFGNGAKTIHWRGKQHFQQMVLAQLSVSM